MRRGFGFLGVLESESGFFGSASGVGQLGDSFGHVHEVTQLPYSQLELTRVIRRARVDCTLRWKAPSTIASERGEPLLLQPVYESALVASIETTRARRSAEERLTSRVGCGERRSTKRHRCAAIVGPILRSSSNSLDHHHSSAGAAGSEGVFPSPLVSSPPEATATLSTGVSPAG